MMQLTQNCNDNKGTVKCLLKYETTMAVNILNCHLIKKV